MLGINSGLALLRAAGAALSAYIGTDDRLRGVKAAEHMIAAGVSNPVSGSVAQPCSRREASRVTERRDCLLCLQVVVDHGLAPNASVGDLWSEERWHGFSSTFEGQGITPVRLGIKSQPAAWELSSGMQVLAAMQASMLSSALARCEHDGILTMGSQSLQQVAHLAMERGCWSGGGVNYTKHGVSGAAVLATFDDDQLARTMLEAEALEVIISGTHDAKYVVRTAAPSPSISCMEHGSGISAQPRVPATMASLLSLIRRRSCLSRCSPWARTSPPQLYCPQPMPSLMRARFSSHEIPPAWRQTSGVVPCASWKRRCRTHHLSSV